MAYLAQHDSLTDLPNRILLDDRLKQAITLAHRRKHNWHCCSWTWIASSTSTIPWAMTIGDRLLQSVAHRLRACVRNIGHGQPARRR